MDYNKRYNYITWFIYFSIIFVITFNTLPAISDDNCSRIATILDDRPYHLQNCQRIDTHIQCKIDNQIIKKFNWDSHNFRDIIFIKILTDLPIEPSCKVTYKVTYEVVVCSVCPIKLFHWVELGYTQ